MFKYQSHSNKNITPDVVGKPQRKKLMTIMKEISNSGGAEYLITYNTMSHATLYLVKSDPIVIMFTPFIYRSKNILHTKLKADI